MASIFDKLKAKLVGTKNSQPSTSSAKLFVLNPFGDNEKANKEANAVYMACLNAITRVVSKVYPTILTNGKVATDMPNLAYLLKYRPNPMQNAVSFIKQVVTSYMGEKIAVIYIDKDIREAKPDNQVKALWLVDVCDSNFKISVTDTATPRMIFSFKLGDRKITCYEEDLIILTRETSVQNPYVSNSKALDKIVSLIDKNFQGLEKAIANANVIRFLAKSGTILNEDARNKRQETLNEIISKVTNNGALYIDGVSDIIQLNQTPSWNSTDAVKPFMEQVYEYMGTDKLIVNNTATDDQINNWVESVIEGFTNEYGTELTIKLFSKNSIAKGREIYVDTNRLFTASHTHRIQDANILIQSGKYYPNEIRGLLGLDLLDEKDNEIIERIDRVDSGKEENPQEQPKEEENNEQSV